MAKFRYYIVAPYNGMIYGTNDTVAAVNMGGSEDDYVIDTETNEWIQNDGTRQQIGE